jgi:predicted small metal-binding protein
MERGPDYPLRNQRRHRMTKVVRCACGLNLRDADEMRLIGQVQQHAKEAHDLDLNEEQVRAMMEIEQE